jgi:hypothetical protein
MISARPIQSPSRQFRSMRKAYFGASADRDIECLTLSHQLICPTLGISGVYKIGSPSGRGESLSLVHLMDAASIAEVSSVTKPHSSGTIRQVRGQRCRGPRTRRNLVFPNSAVSTSRFADLRASAMPSSRLRRRSIGSAITMTQDEGRQGADLRDVRPKHP